MSDNATGVGTSAAGSIQASHLILIPLKKYIYTVANPDTNRNLEICYESTNVNVLRWYLYSIMQIMDNIINYCFHVGTNIFIYNTRYLK